MFEVLAYVYENYWGGDSCPELPALQRKLNAVGFHDGEVQDALLWLDDLKSATRCLQAGPALTAPHHGLPDSPITLSAYPNASTAYAMRVFTLAEQAHMGSAAWGFVLFLMSVGVLPAQRLELVMDRVMAAPGNPVNIIDLKLIVLMMFWSLGEEPDALMLDELCDHQGTQLAH